VLSARQANEARIERDKRFGVYIRNIMDDDFEGYGIDEDALRRNARVGARDEMLGINAPQLRGSTAREKDSYAKFADTAYEQAKTGYAQLVASAATNQSTALAGEVLLRKQAAVQELDARKKANKTVSEAERKRVQQVLQIDKSIQSINQTFAKADAQFLSSLTDGVDGVNFRADRPQ
jgi:hypothetical protein